MRNVINMHYVKQCIINARKQILVLEIWVGDLQFLVQNRVKM